LLCFIDRDPLPIPPVIARGGFMQNLRSFYWCVEPWQAALMKSPKIALWLERTGSSDGDRRGMGCGALSGVMARSQSEHQRLWGCYPQLGDGVAIAAKNRLALTLRQSPAAADLSGGASRRNPDAARRLEIVGGLNFKLYQWQITGDNKQFASGFYEVC
jgi:hypothetical protein